MKSILLHIHEDDGQESRMQAAFDLARVFNGHITCLHATPSGNYLDTDPLVAAALPEEYSETMSSARAELRQRIEARLQVEGVSWEWVHFDEPMAGALIRYSILTDVIVVSLGTSAVFRSDPLPLAASVSVGASTPVLAVPVRLTALRLDKPAILAWNGSPEAAAAARSALPILSLVPQVFLLEVEDQLSPYPRDLAARYLSRWGVSVEIVQRGPIDGSVSSAIEEAAQALDAGIVVMGAYGRSRLREYLLGGVTRELSGRSDRPLLLAH